MIEQFLQTALEFLKEIWFQLNSQFDLENTEAFKFIQPYLLQLQDEPKYIGVALAVLVLIPYGLLKIRNASKERERKLDELMEEMEEDEEYDEDDPRRLRKPEPESDEDEDDAKPLFSDEKTETPSHVKTLNDTEENFSLENPLEMALDEFDHTDEEELSTKPEETTKDNAEPISSQLTDSEFDKDLNEFMAEELEWKKEGTDNISDSLDFDETSHEQAIKDLQKEGELMDLDGDTSTEDTQYYEFDDDEQDKAIKNLQEEMERTISQLTEQIEEPAEHNIKQLSDIQIGGDATIDEDYTEEFYLEDSSTPESSATPISELSDSEILASLEPELEAEEPTFESEGEEPVSSTTPISELPDLASLEPEFELEKEEPSFAETEEQSLGTAGHEYESEPTSESFTFEPESDAPMDEPTPETPDFRFDLESMELGTPQDSNVEQSSHYEEPDSLYASSEKSDSLIDRLKYLQTRFENRYQPTEPDNVPTPREKKVQTQEDFVSESFTEPRRYTSASAGIPKDSGKYMDLLESFIFMKDQKKHK